MAEQPRTHSAAIGLTFDEWNSWRGAARDAGFEHTSDWVRDVVAQAINSPGTDEAPADDVKRDLAKELAHIGARLGALTDSLESQPDSETITRAREATDKAAESLSTLAQAVIDRW